MSSSENISQMRKDYQGDDSVLDISTLVSREPFGVFKHWFDIACDTKSIAEPNAMVLATATKEGRPSARTLLLKGYDDTGFWWFTNYNSQKGCQLAENPWASMLFYWCNMLAGDGDVWSRQVRIQGQVEKMSAEQSTEYFNQRPKGSQIGACVSRQSAVIAGRQVLYDKQKDLEELYKDVEHIPRPEYWGGYILRPNRFEFWQGRSNRLHDRLVFRLPEENKDPHEPTQPIDKTLTVEGTNGWLIERLSP